MYDCLTKWFFIYRTYPDYTIVNDKYLYTQEEGDILKNSITLKSKGKETLKLTVRPNGDIVKVDNKKKEASKIFWLPLFNRSS
jgi:hypothetical protein